MIKPVKFVFALALVATFASCSKSPKACFSVSVQSPNGKFLESASGKVGESLLVSQLCSDHNVDEATVFDFGDGNTGTGAGEIEHVYTKPGTYTIKCTVYGGENGTKNDKSDVVTKTVTIKPDEATNNNNPENKTM